MQHASQPRVVCPFQLPPRTAGLASGVWPEYLETSRPLLHLGTEPAAAEPGGIRGRPRLRQVYAAASRCSGSEARRTRKKHLRHRSLDKRCSSFLPLWGSCPAATANPRGGCSNCPTLDVMRRKLPMSFQAAGHIALCAVSTQSVNHLRQAARDGRGGRNNVGLESWIFRDHGQRSRVGNKV